MRFDGKVAIVTGASSGIGEATAIEFVKAGAKVAINGRNAKNLAETAKKCIAAGAKKNDVVSVVGDITKEADRAKLVDETKKHFGHIDILVNCAGYMIFEDILKSGLDDMDKMLDVHVRAPFDLTQKVVPFLIPRKGVVVNVSSGVSIRPNPGGAVYCIAKAAMDHMTKIFALALAEKGVRVNSVNPGVVLSNITPDQEGQKAVAKQIHPTKEIGLPVHLARSILYLSWDQVPLATGVILPVDGGYSIA